MIFITNTDLKNLKLFKRMCLLTDSPFDVEQETWQDIYQQCEEQLCEDEFYLDTIASCIKMYVDFYRFAIYLPMDFSDYVKDALLDVKASIKSETFRLVA